LALVGVGSSNVRWCRSGAVGRGAAEENASPLRRVDQFTPSVELCNVNAFRPSKRVVV